MLMRRWGVAVVRGRSMLPTLREGDRLLVDYGRRPQVGQAALVRFEDVVAVKRLALHEGDEWWFERDNPSEGVDSWTRGTPSRSADILGTVVLRIWPRTRRL